MVRIIAAVTLLAFLMGCSGLHEIPLATDQPGSSLPCFSGQRVRVTLGDGSRHEGKVESVSPEEVVLATIGNDGKTTARYAREEIVRLEVEESGGWVGWTGFGVFMACAVLIAGMSTMSFGSD